jgi:AraC-like DNA-binding protein
MTSLARACDALLPRERVRSLTQLRHSAASDIVDAQRAELVVCLIEDRSRSLPAVAELLGFSTERLARWFREEFGRSHHAMAFGILVTRRLGAVVRRVLSLRWRMRASSHKEELIQSIVAKVSAKLPHCEERHQNDKHHDSHNKYALQTSSTDVRNAFRRCLTVPHPDQRFFNDVKRHQYCCRAPDSSDLLPAFCGCCPL